MSMEDLITGIEENYKKQVTVIADALGKSEDEVRNQFAENLTITLESLNKKQELLQTLQSLLTEKTQLEADQKAQEEEQKFLEIEKELLASLPEAEQTRIATMRSWLQEQYWEKYETSYKQAIMKLHNKEAVIGSDAVQFLYARKELYKQELQLDKSSEDIFDYKYIDFDGKKITRREVKQRVLDKDHPSNPMVMEAFKKAESEGKYLATKANTFDSILSWFEWNNDQKIKAIQFLTGFVGRWIISLEKDENNCRRFLKSDRYENGTNVCGNDGPDDEGALLLAKDC